MDERFRAVFEGALIGIGLVNLDGLLILSNRALEEMLGYDSGGLDGVALASLFHPEEARIHLSLAQEVLSGRRDRYQLESRWLHRSGDAIWAVCAGSLARNREHRPQFAVLVARDITRRWRAEEEVRRRGRQREAVAEVNQYALATSDLQALLREAARQVARTLEIEYAGIAELFPEDDRLLLLAGVGWEEGLVIPTQGPNGAASQGDIPSSPIVPPSCRIFAPTPASNHPRWSTNMDWYPASRSLSPERSAPSGSWRCIAPGHMSLLRTTSTSFRPSPPY